MPRTIAKRFIEIMAHPLNRPVIDPNKNIVVQGYGIVYPWLGIIPAFREDKSSRTLYRQVDLWQRGQRDIGVYKYAFPDIHQYIFDEGTFTGKGIYDVEVFQSVLDNRFPANRLLSHDQVESFYIRSALATDMVLLEGTVGDALNDYKRKERWTRGDWQDVCWMFGKVPARVGDKLFAEHNPVSFYNKWKIFDKVRRTFVPQSLLFLLIFGWFTPQIPVIAWTLFVSLIAVFNRIPVTLNPIAWRRLIPRIFFFAAFDMSLLLYSAYQNISVAKTIFGKKLITNPNLNWVSASEAGKYKETKTLKGILNWAKEPLICVWLINIALYIFNPQALVVSLPILIFWSITPFMLYRLSGPEFPGWLSLHSKLWYLGWLMRPRWAEDKLKRTLLNADDIEDSQKDYLRDVAFDTWGWFKRYVNEEENWLPPDNTIYNSADEIAEYTSPTNIGLYLVSVISAYDLGFISKDEAVRRIENTLNTVQKLEKWYGHLFNYYNTRTLAATRRYISVVDSGNFLASLIVVVQSFPENKVSKIASVLLEEMNFAPLYDFERGFFYTGYDQDVQHITNSYDTSWSHLTALEEEISQKFAVSYYDLLVSEARLGSFTAIAKGDIPDIHWFNLKRPVSDGANKVILSWGGTAFEFLMPQLFMKEKEIAPYWLGLNNLRAVKAQIEYAKKNTLPVWGISESAYPVVTPDGRYFYKAFGTPSLGIKYLTSDEKARNIIAPYASILSVEYAPCQVVSNLINLEGVSVRGEYGFYDSIDLDEGKVSISYMSHHQGMSLIALNNYLNKGIVRERFHSHPLISNAENLLAEDSLLEDEFNMLNLKRNRMFDQDTSPPEANLLSNRDYSLGITNKGNGASKMSEELCGDPNFFVTRFREDLLKDQGKYFYIKDKDTRKIWSLGFDPLKENPDSYEVIHDFHSTQIIHKKEGIKIEAKLFVPNEGSLEIWQITLQNEGKRERNLSVTSYLEWVLNNIGLDINHPFYNRLFIKTSYDPSLKAIFAEHKKTNILGFHSVDIEPFAFETSRRDFIGRGRSLDSPQALDKGLSNSQGYTLDAIGSLEVDIKLLAFESKTIIFTIGAAKDREEAKHLITKYTDSPNAYKALRDSSFATRKHLYNLGLSYREREIIASLISKLIYRDADLQGDIQARISNRGGQPELWKYGISGDWPIILFKISSLDRIKDVMTLIKGQGILKDKLFTTELLILNTCKNNKEKDEINSALNILLQPRVFILNETDISQEDLWLLESWARVVINDSLEASFGDAKDGGKESYGYFTENGKEYVIKTALTPRPWSHILANSEYGTVVTNAGAGYSWYKNAQQNRITPFAPDGVTDDSRKILYIQDLNTNEIFSPTYNPFKDSENLLIKYGLGYAVFERAKNNISTQLTVFVPQDEPLEVWILKLKNLGKERKRLAVTNYFELVLGDTPENTRHKVLSYYDKTLEALLFSNKTGNFKDAIAFSSLNLHPVSFETDRQRFIGVNRDLNNPESIEKRELSGSQGINVESIASLSGEIEIEPFEEKVVVFTLGEAQSFDEAAALIGKYKDTAKAEESLENTKSYWLNLLESFKVDTPDRELNIMVNYWLKYQSIACHLWARTGYYQSGGAIGFRDQLQTSLIGLYTDPEITRRQIILHSAHQFEEGDVQHWWHPENNLGARTLISDNLLWLAYTIYHYVTATGDWSILDIEIPYLKGRLLEEGKEGDVFIPEISDRKDTIYKHALKAIDYTLDRFGPHGLPLIGAGDWNDGFSNVGMKGRGESVWLAFFLYDVLVKFSKIVEATEGKEREEYYLMRAESLRKATEEYCWDGDWYVRIFDDDGNVIGSKESDEWKIDLIPQAWGVISGAADKKRVIKAMKSVEEYLIKGNLVLLSAPPFEHTKLNPGKIKDYPPGVRENGGQYTHAATWLVLALSLLGEKERAYQVFKGLLPITHDPDVYEAEPYILAADVYGVGHLEGKAGWTWYTGAAAWLFRAAVEGMLGVRLENGEISLSGSLPEQLSPTKVWRKGEKDITKKDGGNEFDKSIFIKDVKVKLFDFYEEEDWKALEESDISKRLLEEARDYGNLPDSFMFLILIRDGKGCGGVVIDIESRPFFEVKYFDVTPERKSLGRIFWMCLAKKLLEEKFEGGYVIPESEGARRFWLKQRFEEAKGKGRKLFINRVGLECIASGKNLLDEEAISGLIPENQSEETGECDDIIALYGGTGGRFFGESVRFSELDKFLSQDLSTVLAISPHDNGGASRKLQDKVAKVLGYIPSPGDTMNILSGFSSFYKKLILGTRFKDDIQPQELFVDKITEFLQKAVHMSKDKVLVKNNKLICNYLEFYEKKYGINYKVSTRILTFTNIKPEDEKTKKDIIKVNLSTIEESREIELDGFRFTLSNKNGDFVLEPPSLLDEDWAYFSAALIRLAGVVDSFKEDHSLSNL